MRLAWLFVQKPKSSWNIAVGLSKENPVGEAEENSSIQFSRSVVSDSLVNAAAAAKSPQSCLTLCNPIDGSPPGFPVPAAMKLKDTYSLEGKL